LKSRIDILGIDQTKTEMSDPSGTASLSRSLLKNEHIPRAGRLRLNKAVPLVHRNDAEYFLIKSQRALGITNRKSDVRQTVCSDCGCACFHSKGSLSEDFADFQRGRLAGFSKICVHLWNLRTISIVS
jgi:hypothetical protein